MNRFNQKLKLIFLPYLLIATATIGIYTFFNWLLIIRLKLFVVDDIIVNGFIPVGFMFLNLAIWLLPRLRLLKLTFGYRKNPLFGLILLAGGAMVLPVGISQYYLDVVTGRLTTLDHVSQINNYPATQYYKIKHYYADKHLERIKYVSEISNKSKDFDMSVYIAVPVFDSKLPADTVKQEYIILADSFKHIPILVNGTPITENVLPKFTRSKVQSASIITGAKAMALYGKAAGKGVLIITLKPQYTVQDALDPPTVKERVVPSVWLGFVYQRTISNKLTVAEKEDKFKAFARDCQDDLDRAPIDNAVYLSRINYSFDRRKLVTAIRSNKNDQSDNIQNIFSPVYEPFESRTGNSLLAFFGSFVIGSAIFLIILQFFQLRDIVDIENYKF
jgi:hypothetical protein